MSKVLGICGALAFVIALASPAGARPGANAAVSSSTPALAGRTSFARSRPANASISMSAARAPSSRCAVRSAEACSTFRSAAATA